MKTTQSPNSFCCLGFHSPTLLLIVQSHHFQLARERKRESVREGKGKRESDREKDTGREMFWAGLQGECLAWMHSVCSLETSRWAVPSLKVRGRLRFWLVVICIHCHRFPIPVCSLLLWMHRSVGVCVWETEHEHYPLHTHTSQG